MAFIQVKSKSSDDVYDVFFGEADGKLQITCSCQAGQNRMACWHRTSIIEGDLTAIVVGTEHVPQLLELVALSELPAILREIDGLQQQAEIIKKRLSAVKKQLGRLLG